MQIRGVVGAVVIVGLALASCKKNVVIGSCDRRSPTEVLSLCTDIVNEATEPTCNISLPSQAAGVAAKTPCDHTAALAGCRESNNRTTWYFASKRARTAAQVASACGATLLGPDGKELTGVVQAPMFTDAEIEIADALPAYKPKIETVLAAIERIGTSLPKASSKTIVSPVEIKNVLVMHVEDLAAITEYAPLMHRVGGSGRVGLCARIVRKNDTKDATDIVHLLSDCAAAQFLVVVRDAMMVEPKASESINSYTGGKAAGDVMLFDLSTGKLVGAAPFTATSSRDVKMTFQTFDVDLRKDFDQQLDIAWSAARSSASPKPQ